MPHNDDPDENYPALEEPMFPNTIYVYAAQKERIVELMAKIEVAQSEIDKLRIRDNQWRLKWEAAVDSSHIEKLMIAETKLRKLEQAITEIRMLIESSPSGIDYEADPCDTSPADVVAFTSGLIWQICERVR